MTDLSHKPKTNIFVTLAKSLFASRILWSSLGVTAIVLLVGVYVVQMAESTRQGYQLRDLEREVSALDLEHEQLSVELAQKKSLSTVSERMKILGFVPSHDTLYLTTTSSVARSE